MRRLSSYWKILRPRQQRTKATFVVNAATDVWGGLAGYKGTVWTNWYRRSLVKGVLTLAYMRNTLNKKNLVNTYPKGSLTGFQAEGQTQPLPPCY